MPRHQSPPRNLYGSSPNQYLKSLKPSASWKTFERSRGVFIKHLVFSTLRDQKIVIRLQPYISSTYGFINYHKLRRQAAITANLEPLSDYCGRFVQAQVAEEYLEASPLEYSHKTILPASPQTTSMKWQRWLQVPPSQLAAWQSERASPAPSDTVVEKAVAVETFPFDVCLLTTMWNVDWPRFCQCDRSWWYTNCQPGWAFYIANNPQLAFRSGGARFVVCHAWKASPIPELVAAIKCISHVVWKDLVTGYCKWCKCIIYIYYVIYYISLIISANSPQFKGSKFKTRRPSLFHPFPVFSFLQTNSHLDWSSPSSWSPTVSELRWPNALDNSLRPLVLSISRAAKPAMETHQNVSTCILSIHSSRPHMATKSTCSFLYIYGINIIANILYGLVDPRVKKWFITFKNYNWQLCHKKSVQAYYEQYGVFNICALQPYSYNYNLTHFRTPYIKTTCEYLMDSMAWHLFKRTSANATADAIQNTWSTCSAEVALFKELLQVCFLQAFLQQPFQRDSHATKVDKVRIIACFSV